MKNIKEKNGAVRGKNRNKSSFRQILIARFSKVLPSCLSNIRFWLHLKKWSFLIFLSDLETGHLYHTRCKKGFHFNSKGYSSLDNGKKKYKVWYLTCKICQTKFFSTHQDKRKFERLTSNKRKIYKQTWSKIKEVK